VVPERCERFRESVSLGLDGMLSTFERALLERHLRRCASCQAFAADVRAHTKRLRAAPLVAPPPLAGVAPARARLLRRRATGLAGAVAVGLVAALVSLTPAGEHRNAVVAQPSSNEALLKVVPATPTANATFQIPRLRLVAASSADGPVRGYYGVPA
jgi:predicted anti-sigma-YlaC factor YlaD